MNNEPSIPRLRRARTSWSARSIGALIVGLTTAFAAVDVPAQTAPRQPDPRIVGPAGPTMRAPKLMSREGLVCIPYEVGRGRLFHCKARADIYADMSAETSPKMASILERDYKAIAAMLGVDGTRGSFTVCPQGGAFAAVNLPADPMALASDITPVMGGNSVYEVRGAAAQQVDSGCSNAGGGLGSDAEFSGSRDRGGSISYDGFTSAGGSFSGSGWQSLTNATAAALTGMQCRNQGGNSGLISDGGTTLGQLWDSFVGFFSGDAGAASGESSSEVGVHSTGAKTADQQNNQQNNQSQHSQTATNPDGSNTTRTVSSDGTFTERTTQPNSPDSKTTTITKDGQKTIKEVWRDKDGNHEVTRHYLSNGNVQWEEEKTTEYGSGFDRPGGVAREKTEYRHYGTGGEPEWVVWNSKRPSGGGAKIVDPEGDRSCAGQQAWAQRFVEICSQVDWRSPMCFQAVMLVNGCTDPSNITPSPNGPDLMCRATGQGSTPIDMWKAACERRKQFAISNPDYTRRAECTVPPVTRPTGVDPGLVNPAPDGGMIGPAGPSGRPRPSPACAPGDVACAGSGKRQAPMKPSL